MGFLAIFQAQQTQMYGRNPDLSEAKAISRCLQGSQDSTFNILIKAWKNTKQPHRLFFALCIAKHTAEQTFYYP